MQKQSVSFVGKALSLHSSSDNHFTHHILS